jgi:surfeit locus 1 family protein
MRIGSLSFQPRPVTTVATVLFVALTTYLGVWQRHRAEEKRERQVLLEARAADAPVTLTGPVAEAEPLLFRHVRAAGTFDGAHQVFVDNQIHAGRAGFHVVTPLRLRGQRDVLLVNRGWIARDAAYPKAPAVPVPAGDVQVTGMASLPPARFVELSADTMSGDVWQNLSIARFAARTGLAPLPVVVLADGAAPGLVAVREKPDAGIDKHVEYELTWFSLAATALVLWIALNTKRGKP